MPPAAVTVYVSWQEAARAQSYHVYRSAQTGARVTRTTGDRDSPLAVIKHYDGVGRYAYIDDEGKRTYAYRVVAMNSFGVAESTESNPADRDASVPVALAPPKPAGLNAQVIGSGDAGSIDLKWVPDSSATGYRIFRDDVAIGHSPTTLYTDSEGVGAGSYSYRVEAYNEGGYSDRSDSETATILRDPLPLSFNDVADDNIINIAEKAAGFEISGSVGSEGAGAAVEVTFGGASKRTALAGTSGDWSVSVPATASFISGQEVRVDAVAKLQGHADATRTLNLQVDLVKPALAGQPTYALGVVAVTDTAQAGLGSTIKVNFATSEQVEDPTAMIGAQAAAVSGSGTSWTATYEVAAGINVANAQFDVGILTDLAGNPSDDPLALDSGIEIDTTRPSFAYGAPPSSLAVAVAIAELAVQGPSGDIEGYEVGEGSLLPAGLTLDASSGGISGTPTAASAQPNAVMVVATDTAGNEGEAAIVFPAVAKGAQELVGFTYDPATVRLGVEVPAPTAPSGAVTPLTYASSTGGVCAAIARTGALQNLRVGTCVIIATAEETANYAAAIATASVVINERLAAPAGLAADLDDTGTSSAVELSWTASEFADGYRIFRNGSPIGTSASTVFVDSNLGPGSYAYAVVAFEGSFDSARSNAVDVAVGLGVPRSLNAVAVGRGPGSDVELSWIAPLGAAGYRIFREGVEIGTSRAASYRDADPGVTHHGYEVEAFVGSVVSERTPTVRIVVGPSAPTGLTAAAIGSGDTAVVSLSWHATGGAGEYFVYRNGHFAVGTDATSAVDDCDAVATCAGLHSYKVAAWVYGPDGEVDYDVLGERSAAVQVWVAPDAPASLAATPFRSGSVTAIRLSWEAAVGASSYVITRAGREIARSSATSFTDETAGTGTHVYRVAAFNDGGVSTRQASATVALAQFGAYAEAAGSGRQGDVRLSWDAAAGAASYRIFRDGSRIGTTAEQTFADADPGVGSHSYAVAALDSSGSEIDRTAAVAAGIPPDPPALLRAAKSGFGSGANITLSWAASEGATSYAIYYDGYRFATTANTLFIDNDTLVGPGRYQVAAMAGDLESELSQELEVLIGIDAPSDLSATPIGAGSDGHVELSWSDVPGTEEYVVYRDGTRIGLGRGSFRSTRVSYVDRCKRLATCAGQHRYSVSGFVSGSSEGYFEGYETQQAKHVTVWIAPDAPEGLAAQVVRSGSASGIRLQWQAALGATEYVIFRKGISIGISSSASYTDKEPGVGTFDYEVAALNDGGSSAKSAAAQASVIQFNLFASVVGTGTGSDVDLTWPGVAGATGYVIFRGGVQFGTASAAQFTDHNPGIGVYSYAVAAYIGRAEVGRTGAVEIAVVPETPVALIAKPIGSGDTGDIALDWRPADGAANYRIIRNGEVLDTTASVGYLDEDPAPGFYSYQVIAFDGEAESEKSYPAEAAIPPEAPTNVNAWVRGKGENARIEVWWSPTPGAVGYDVLLGGDSINGTTQTSFTLTLSAERSVDISKTGKFEVAVVAYGSAGPNDFAGSVASNTFTLWVAPSPPSGLLAKPIGGSDASQIELAWDLAEGATGYRIYRGEEAIGETAENRHIDMHPGIGNHIYRVAALNPGGESERSGSAEARIDAFALRAEVLGSGQTGDVRLRWYRVGGATAYRIYRDGTELGTTSALGYADTNPGIGRYRFQVAAISGSTELARSEQAAVSVAPAPPIISTTRRDVFDDGPNSEVGLDWSTTAGAEGYRLYRNGVEISSTAGTSFTDQPGYGRHAYQVAAYAAGTESELSAPVSIDNVLDASSRLTAEYVGSGGDGYIRLSWDPVQDAFRYVVVTTEKALTGLDYTLPSEREYRAPITEIIRNCTSFQPASCSGELIFGVRAVLEDSTWGVPISTTVWVAPAAPEGLEAHAVRGDATMSGNPTIAMSVHVDLSWELTQGATGYKVLRDGDEIGQLGRVPYYTDTNPGTGPHGYQVSAFNEGGESPLSNTAEVEVAPGTPTHLNAYWSAGAASTVRLAWNALPGAANYRIYRNGASIGTTADEYFDDIGPGVGIHEYQVAGHSGGRETERTTETEVRIRPSAPTGLDAESVGQGLSGDIALSWMPVAGAVEYLVLRGDGGALAPIGRTTSTTFIDIDPGVDGFEYGISAFGGGLYSDNSGTVLEWVPPGEITGLSAQVYGSGADAVLELSWDSPHNASYYVIYQDGNKIEDIVLQAGATLTNSAGYDIVGRHSYQVIALSQDEPTDAIEVYVPPDAPSQPAAWLAEGQAGTDVQLSWYPSSFVDGYVIYRNGELLEIEVEPSLTDDNLAQGAYTYEIETLYDGGASNTRATVNITVGPVASDVPQDLSAIASGSGSSAEVSLAWTAPDGVLGYLIYRDGELIGTSTASNFIDDIPGYGVPCYSVAAAYTSGESIRSKRACTTVQSPYELRASASSVTVGGSVLLDWNDISGAYRYRVFHNGIEIRNSASFYDSELPRFITSQADISITRAGMHYFHVVAANRDGAVVGPPSEQVAVRVSPDLPAAPSGLVAVVRGAGPTGDVDLTWLATPPDASGRSALEGYVIYRDGNLIGFELSTSYTDEDPGVGGPYTYIVVAGNMAGVSGPSQPAEATIADRLAAPHGLTARPQGRNTQADVMLEWLDVAGAAGYHVYRDGVSIAIVSGSSYADRGVAAAEYEYEVAAYSGSEVSDRSLGAATEVLPQPDSPGSVATKAEGKGASGDVALEWDPVQHAVLYRIHRNSSPTAIGTSAETRFTDSDPGEGSHSYQIVAVNSQGRASDPSAARTAVIAGAAFAIDPTISRTFVDLPAPNPSDGKDYRTAEYLNTKAPYVLWTGATVTVAGLDAVKADKAYQRGYFGQGVTVGVVDEGFHSDHPELTLNLLPEPLPLPEPARHGDEVAGVIAAARDGKGVHGVAPLAKLVPYTFYEDPQSAFAQSAFDHAVSIKLPIVNNSWGYNPHIFGRLELADATLTISLAMPLASELMNRHECMTCVSIKSDYLAAKTAIEDEDIVMVWAAGNDGFNSDPDYGKLKGCRLAEGDQPGTFRVLGDCERYSTQEIVDGFTILPLTVYQDSGDFFGEVRLADLDFGLNSLSAHAMAPSLYPELLGRWVAVAGVTPDKRMYFNGCGKAMHYCMSAPGIVRGLNGEGIAGTSFAAPYVSGALAVLKSRFPDMPMYAILAILFHTAEDLGEPGTDEVFGRGFLDLDAATSVQGRVSIAFDPPNGAPARSARLAETAVRVPPALSGIALQAEGISVAVNFLDDHYYNMPLSGLFEEPDSWKPALGWVAREMLEVPLAADLGSGFAAEANSRTGELRSATHEGPFWRFDYERCRDCASSSWREYRSSRIAAPFFAAGGEAAVGELDLGSGWSTFGALGISGRLEDPEGMRYRQLGLRWKLAPAGEAKWGGLFELSRSDEDEALLGGDYSGALAVGDAQTYQARLQGELNLGKGWSAAGGYTAGWVRAETQAGSMIEQIGGIRFAGWRAYLESRSLLTTSDALRIGIVRQVAIEDGFMRIRHGVVDGDAVFSEEHYMNLNGSYGLAESIVRLGREGALGMQLGYTFSPLPGMRAAVGLEHSGSVQKADDYAGSFELRWDL